MKKNIKIISIAILCWVVLFALATYAGPTEQVREGTIMEINDIGNNGPIRMAKVVDNTDNNGRTYQILLIPIIMPDAVYSNVGERIIFKLFRGGNNNDHEGVQIHKDALRMQ